MQRTRLKNQRGIALLAVIFFLVVIAGIGIIFISLSSNGISQSASDMRGAQALYVAEGGLERARGYLTVDSPAGTCAGINGAFTNIPLGPGQFTVTSSTLGGNCVLTSSGGVPNLATGAVQRTVSYATLTSIQDAWAVGYDVNLGGGTHRPFMAHWDGTTWTNLTASAPNISSANLMEVSASSSTDAWAVSSAGQFIHWNGTSWSLVQTLAGNPQLNSIYLNTSNDGWAVDNNGRLYRWTGGPTWALYASFTATNALLGIYCMSSTYCWAVGNRSGGTNNINLWNGTSWGLVATSGFNANFRYVSCVDTVHCWAVGNSGGEVIFWNGTAWALVDNGNPSLWGVDCVDNTHCWAVGRTSGGGNQVDYWNGTTWTLQSPPTGQNLWFVSCVTATDCWAAGVAGVMVHWNGTTWSSPITFTGGGTTSQINSITQFRSGNSTTSWKEVIQ